MGNKLFFIFLSLTTNEVNYCEDKDPREQKSPLVKERQLSPQIHA